MVLSVWSLMREFSLLILQLKITVEYYEVALAPTARNSFHFDGCL